MKRCLLPAVALALLPTVMRAQATAPVRVTVSTEVQLSSTGTTDFGMVGTLGQNYVIDPARPTGAQKTAKFTATAGTPGASISVSWAGSVELCHEAAGCGTKLLFTPRVSSTPSNASDNQSTSTPIGNGATQTLNEQGELYFWLGGSITVATGAAPGLYTGTFTLVATY